MRIDLFDRDLDSADRLIEQLRDLRRRVPRAHEGEGQLLAESRDLLDRMSLLLGVPVPPRENVRLASRLVG